MGPHQRALANRRVAFRDGDLDARYLFPFWDATWSISFVLIDFLGGPGPSVFRGPMEADQPVVRADAPRGAARPLATFPRETFRDTYHLDPWWVFRGMGAVGDAYRDVILPTNIARSFRAGGTEWKAHDAEFDVRLERVLGIEGRDANFVRKTFTKATLDLSETLGRKSGR